MPFYYKGQPVRGPRGPAGPDGNPVGTVISFLGLTAPEDYLICDGASYNLSDYPELAAFFETQFGAKNHFGGDGETTFAVPDMRNLFLRGFHGEAEEQLSGEIGATQEGTEIPNLAPMTAGVYASAIGQFSEEKQNMLVENEDTFINPVQHFARCFGNEPFENVSDWPDLNAKSPGMRYTARPVNMAVLFCVKAVESVPAENGHSTEEIRIGTWIDGKPLYRKVFAGVSPDAANGAAIADIAGLSLDTVVNGYGWINANSGIRQIPYTMDTSNACFSYISSDRSSLMMVTRGQEFIGKSFLYTIEYTKTTG